VASDELERVLNAFAAAVRDAGGDAEPVAISSPVPERSVTKAEKELGFAFPPLFRRFLTTKCGGVTFSWNLDDGREITLEGEREAIYGGDFTWSFDTLVAENKTYQAQDIEGDDLLMEMVGRDKIILVTVPSGDMFAVGVSGPIQDRVVYLSHDIEDIHNYVVASDIDDLLRRYAPLGFAGPEFWIWEQFTNGRTTMIDPSSEKAMEFLGSLERPA
jgi:hypothetical protein